MSRTVDDWLNIIDKEAVLDITKLREMVYELLPGWDVKKVDWAKNSWYQLEDEKKKDVGGMYASCLEVADKVVDIITTPKTPDGTPKDKNPIQAWETFLASNTKIKDSEAVELCRDLLPAGYIYKKTFVRNRTNRKGENVAVLTQELWKGDTIVHKNHASKKSFCWDIIKFAKECIWPVKPMILKPRKKNDKFYRSPSTPPEQQPEVLMGLGGHKVLTERMINQSLVELQKRVEEQGGKLRITSEQGTGKEAPYVKLTIVL